MTPKIVVGIRSDDSAAHAAAALGAELAQLWDAELVVCPRSVQVPHLHRGELHQLAATPVG